MNRFKHIIICGNIGVGKSTVTQKISEAFGHSPIYEEPDQIKQLPDFYQGKLTHRLESYLKAYDILKAGGSVVQDRSMSEDYHVFASNAFNCRQMSSRQIGTYRQVFQTVHAMFKKPELFVFLDCHPGKLKSRIQERGRQYEKSVSLQYLTKIAELYSAWFHGMTRSEQPIVRIDTTDLDVPGKDWDLFLTQLADELMLKGIKGR